jgi:anti-anti-sigma factor
MDRLLTLKPLIEEQALQIRKSLLVDLTAVDFLDSAAVGVLAILYRQVYKHKLRMAFINPQPQAEAVLSMVGLSEMVPGYASKEEALSDLGL